MAATAMPAAAVAAPVTVDASTVTDAVVDASTEATPTMELKAGAGAGAAPSTSVAPRFEEQVLQARVLARGVLTAAGGKKADASATLMHPHGALPARLSPPRLHNCRLAPQCQWAGVGGEGGAGAHKHWLMQQSAAVCMIPLPHSPAAVTVGSGQDEQVVYVSDHHAVHAIDTAVPAASDSSGVGDLPAEPERQCVCGAVAKGDDHGTGSYTRFASPCACPPRAPTDTLGFRCLAPRAGCEPPLHRQARAVHGGRSKARGLQAAWC